MKSMESKVTGKCPEVINFRIHKVWDARVAQLVRIHKVVKERRNLTYCRFIAMETPYGRTEDLE